MGKYDSSRNSRYSRTSVPSTTAKLNHLPVVRGSVLEKDDWSEVESHNDLSTWNGHNQPALTELESANEAPDLFAVDDDPFSDDLVPSEDDELPIPEDDELASAERAAVSPPQPAVQSGLRPTPPEAPASGSIPALQEPEQVAIAGAVEVDAFWPSFSTLVEAGKTSEAHSVLEEEISTRFEQDRSRDACALYRRAAPMLPEARWSERCLQALMMAADECSESMLVAEATRLLLRIHPESAYIPAALLATAEHQIAGGRPDLARATLEYVAASYASTKFAEAAQRRLAQLA